MSKKVLTAALPLTALLLGAGMALPSSAEAGVFFSDPTVVYPISRSYRGDYYLDELWPLRGSYYYYDDYRPHHRHHRHHHRRYDDNYHHRGHGHRDFRIHRRH